MVETPYFCYDSQVCVVDSPLQVHQMYTCEFTAQLDELAIILIHQYIYPTSQYVI